jgi:hypothetical protein
VPGPFSNAIFYAIPGIDIDYDGAPDAYAPPVSAKHIDQPKNGKKGLDRLRNGTNDSHAVFNENGKNTFKWTGVIANEIGKDPDLDTREFLRDSNDLFPSVNNDPSSPFKGFYKPSSRQGSSGLQINASNTCYGVISGSLKRVGIKMGDVGVAINMKSGAGTSFMYCDAAGESEAAHPNKKKFKGKYSRGVSEFSVKVKDELGSTERPVAVISFPGSTLNADVPQTQVTDSLLRSCLQKIPGLFAYNEILPRLTTNRTYQSNIKNKLVLFGLSILASPFHPLP